MNATVPTSAAGASTIVVIGKENVGKTQLSSGLAGLSGKSTNFRGSTVSVDRYESGDVTWIDTPGLERRSDAETTRQALRQLDAHDTVLLVAQATHLDDDLRDLLPLVVGKRGAVVVTFWDKVEADAAAQRALDQLAAEVGVPFIPIDGRRLSPEVRREIKAAVAEPSRFLIEQPRTIAGWRIEPPAGLWEHRVIGPILACVALLAPAAMTIFAANAFAGWLDPLVRAVLDPRLAELKIRLSPLFADLLVSDYGLLSMGPFLLVWALPTVLLYAAILGAYKTSGLVERLNTALHPLLRPVGLTGRDAVRVLMGFGCNVPAIISTRSCSSCTRQSTIAAISFGAACSYQLPATMAVFAAVGQAWLIWPYLGYLLVTTLVFTRWMSSAEARSPLNDLLLRHRTFMKWPELAALRREVSGTLRQFFFNAMPIFVVICFVASLLKHFGLIDTLSAAIGPLMSLFRLPAEAAIPVVMACLRKDGISLFTNETLAAQLSPGQVLTGIYLAGVLLPCLVTSLTIAREQSSKFASKLLARQLAAAVLFTFVLSRLM